MNAMNPSFGIIHCWDSFSTHPSLRSAQTATAPPRGHLSWQPFNASVQSWIGHTRHGETEGLRRVLLAGTPFIPVSRCGWLFDHQSGSHEIWFSPERKRLPIQPASNGKAKAYQIRQFLKIQDEEESNGGQV
jgi:hypothetical protein